jgi:hypothetical protein
MIKMRARVTNWIPRHPKAAIAVAVCGLLAMTGSVAAAEILASATTVIYACVNPTTAVMTLSNKTAMCPNGGSKIHWNQRGSAGLIWMGAWTSGVTYTAPDAVQYQGNSYILASGSTTATPPNSPWQLLAAQGAQGVAGAQGPAGFATSATEVDNAAVDVGYFHPADGSNWVAVAGGAAFTITLGSQDHVLIQVSINTPGNAAYFGRFLVDGSPISDSNVVTGGTNDALFNIGPTTTFAYPIQLGAGTHNFAVQAEVLCAGCSGVHSFNVFDRAIAVEDLGA